MPKSKKTLEFQVSVPSQLRRRGHDAWLNPKIPGNPWQEGDKLILDPQVDGLFYWLISGTAHYGRFTKVDRPVASAYLGVALHLGRRVHGHRDF